MNVMTKVDEEIRAHPDFMYTTTPEVDSARSRYVFNRGGVKVGVQAALDHVRQYPADTFNEKAARSFDYGRPRC